MIYWIKFGRATVTRSGTTTHLYFDPSKPGCQTHAHTRTLTRSYAHKVRKELTVSIKTRVDCFNGCFKKVTRTYQRLRHKAAFLKPTNTSFSHQRWCSCLYCHTWYRKVHTAMLQYSKRAFNVYRACQFKLLDTNILMLSFLYAFLIWYSQQIVADI